MASLNRVIIVGNLGSDPEIRRTKKGTSIATLSVATTEHRQVGDKREPITQWHKIIVWGKHAENCEKYLSKGSGVVIEGRLNVRNWEDKSGQRHRVVEVVADIVQFTGPKKQSQPSDLIDF